MKLNKFKFTTIKDLEKEFPNNKYFLIERKEKIKSMFVGIMGDFEILIGSPNRKGDKQPVEYYNWKKNNQTNKDRIKELQDYIQGTNIPINEIEKLQIKIIKIFR